MRKACLILLAALCSSPAFAGHNESIACSQEPALTGDVTTIAGACSTAVGNVPSGSTVNANSIFSNHVVSTSELDKTSNTTVADVTGLTCTLTAGKTYFLTGHLTTSAGASGGVKYQLTASSGLTATSISYSGEFFATTTLSANTTSTALGTAQGATAAITDVDISGAIVVNAGGVVTVQGAQNVSNSTTTKFLINSIFSCIRVN